MPAILVDVAQCDPQTVIVCNALNKRYPRASGIIIVQHEGIDPTLYWDGYNWNSLGSETKSEDPKVYTDRVIGNRIVQKLKQEFPTRKIALAFWYHEDCHLLELERYVKMTGKHFPGSVRK